MANHPEVISCVTDNSLLVTKSQVENFTANSVLIVNESQEALFYKDGNALDLFPAGRHILSADKTPLLNKIFKKLFGGVEEVFDCEVFFINKVQVLDVLWGTPTPITLEDPRYHLIVNVKSSGQTGLRIKDSRRFVVGVVGQLPEFTVESVRRAIKGAMMSSLTSLIAQTVVNEGVGILEISTRLESLSAAVQKRLNEKLEDLGLEIVHFEIATIFADEKDLQKLREAKEKAFEIGELSRARAAARAVEGYTYQDEQKFEVLKTAAANSGTAGGMINAGVGLGVGLGMVNEVRNTTANAIQQSNAPAGAPATCPSCGNSLPAGAKFCANCGNAIPVHPVCPSCSAPLPDGARFCTQCGQPVAPAKHFCPDCGSEIVGNGQFCGNCGRRL